MRAIRDPCPSHARFEIRALREALMREAPADGVPLPGWSAMRARRDDPCALRSKPYFGFSRMALRGTFRCVQGASRHSGGWWISPAIPATANFTLALLWAFSGYGGWGEAAFCADG